MGKLWTFAFLISTGIFLYALGPVFSSKIANPQIGQILMMICIILGLTMLVAALKGLPYNPQQSSAPSQLNDADETRDLAAAEAQDEASVSLVNRMAVVRPLSLRLTCHYYYASLDQLRSLNAPAITFLNPARIRIHIPTEHSYLS